MKKILFTIFILLGTTLFAKAELFDYDMWAKDLEVMIEFSQGLDDTIKGSDKNSNFVRDDVENYIKDKYADDEFQKIMFLEAARKIQQIITLPKTSSVDIHKELDLELLQIYTCRDFILFKHSDADVEKEMQDKSEFKAKVLNTTKRLNAYISHKQKVPFKYSIPSDEELMKQKNACEKLYSRIKSETKKSRVLSAK
jgi:hypothetical protein